MRKPTKNAGQTRYAIYARCSSDDQAHQDFSTTDVQIDLSEEFIRNKKGILSGVYKDEAYTGTTLKRPDWKRLLADAEAGQFDVVVCTYMSRLGRGDTYVVAEHLLREACVKVETVKENFTDDTSGYVSKSMTRFVDGMYVEQVRQWTKTKMEQMVAKGYFCGGTVPFGLKTEIIADVQSYVSSDKEPPKRLVPVPQEAEIVQYAFSLYLEKRTLAAVRDHLRAVTNRKWVTTIVKNLLTNEKYIGVQQFGEWRNERAFEPIIDRQLFQQVQDALAEFSPRIANGDNTFTFYLRSRVCCPHCGCPYTQLSVNRGSAGRNKTRIPYYVCSLANKGKSKCPVVRVNAEALHHTVLEEIGRAAKHHTVMHKLISQTGGWGNADESQKALRGQLAKKRQFNAVQINNINNAIAEGGNFRSLLLTLERLEKEQDELCQQVEAIDGEIAAATIKRPTAEQVQQVWRSLVDLWDVLTEEERTEALGGLLERVEIKEKDRVRLQFFPIAEAHGQLLALNSQMGAGVGLEPTTFGL